MCPVRSERQIIHTDERTGVRSVSCSWYGFIAQSFRCAHATGIGGDRAFACHGEALELMDDLPVPDGTVAQLRSIHRFLSQDVYDWPGDQIILKIGHAFPAKSDYTHMMSIVHPSMQHITHSDNGTISTGYACT